jgi:nitrogen regulatory protein PII
MINQTHMFLRLLRDSFRDLLPIIVVIAFFQLVIINAVPDNWQSTAIGLVIVGIGLAVFLHGLEIGIFPVGEKLAKDFAMSDSTYWILLFAFLIGFGTTIAEPALFVIAEKAAAISEGRIDALWLRIVVALSVGFAIFLGVFRIIKGHPIHYYIITGYFLVVGVTFFAPQEIVGLAYDLGGVTTSTVTVPLVAALGIGLASSIKGRDPVIDGFGLIAFASLTPMIFVQVYGIGVYALVEATDVATVVVQQEVSSVAEITVVSVLSGITQVVKDILPILFIILFFQYGVLKKPIDNLLQVGIGFVLVMIGLYAFILGLEMGLFSLGESMAYQLTKSDSVYLIYLFGFMIGFSTTMAEPALMAIAKKAKEISEGKIDDLVLRIFVALGVAIGIALGAYRIVQGDHIHYYIIVGYLVVIFLTFVAPKYIIPISYDSGGVTTSTVTVPLVAALGIGLATNIEGRSALIDGFGLIAFASLFPMITVMVYGILVEKFVSNVGEERLDDIVLEADEVPHSMVNVNAASPAQKFTLDFSAVVAIVPNGDREETIHFAKEVGATGVTVFNASGMGLKDMENFYRVNYDDKDSVLLFIVPSIISENLVNHLTQKLHLTTVGDGIVFSIDITHLRGISLNQESIFKQEVKEAH